MSEKSILELMDELKAKLDEQDRLMLEQRVEHDRATSTGEPCGANGMDAKKKSADSSTP